MRLPVLVLQDAEKADHGGEEADGIVPAQRMGIAGYDADDGLCLGDGVQPQRHQHGIEVGQRAAQALRGDQQGGCSECNGDARSGKEAATDAVIGGQIGCARQERTAHGGKGIEAEREAVACHHAVAGGRNGQQEGRSDPQCKGNPEGTGRPGHRVAVPDPLKGDAEASDRHHRHRLRSDCDRKRGNRPGRAIAPRAAVRIDEHGRNPHHQDRLDVVMVDRAGVEADIGEGEKAAQTERDVHRHRTRKASSGKPDRVKEAGDEQQWPDGERQGFCLILRQDQRSHPDQCPDRQVHEPRPVHQGATVEAQPVLREVEPALPREKVPHLYQAHHIVIVGTDIVRCGGDEHRQHDGDRHQRVEETEQPGTHRQWPAFRLCLLQMCGRGVWHRLPVCCFLGGNLALTFPRNSKAAAPDEPAPIFRVASENHDRQFRRHRDPSPLLQ